jgi:peroxiredoxin
MEQLKEHELLPGFRLRSVDGDVIGPEHFRGKKSVVLFLFDIGCDECGGFLEEAADRYADYEEANAVIIVVGNAPEGDLRQIRDSLDLPFVLLSDPEGVVLNEYSGGLPTLLVADRYGEIRIVGQLSDSGHLPDQNEILSQLQLIEIECPECGVPDWPDQTIY